MNKTAFIDISVDKYGLQKIIFNKPERKNALDPVMIKLITVTLRESAHNPNIKVTAFSGEGDYFTSGNDLSNFAISVSGGSAKEEDVEISDLMQMGKNMFQEMVAAFIDYPKPLVAVINGPAVGIGVTLLAHFDLVFASTCATFHCPFVRLGQTPEGCSSILFPLLMGYSKAARLLLFGEKISAQEAFESNLVTEVVDQSLLPLVWDRIKAICSLPPNTLRNAKGVLKRRLIPYLHKVNAEESDSLLQQWTTNEFLESLTKFASRKSKL